MPLPVDAPLTEQCGRCVSCINTCFTGAIVELYTLDASRCISYLAIELEGEIPEALLPLIGNRIYSCDDCQLLCLRDRFSRLTNEPDFSSRAVLHAPELVELFGWHEATCLLVTEKSGIRRIDQVHWSRNIAVALGNAPYQYEIVLALRCRLGELPLLDVHIHWALKGRWARREAAAVAVQRAQQTQLVRAIEKGLTRDA